jgi:hypothetical protein
VEKRVDQIEMHIQELEFISEDLEKAIFGKSEARIDMNQFVFAGHGVGSNTALCVT